MIKVNVHVEEPDYTEILDTHLHQLILSCAIRFSGSIWFIFYRAVSSAKVWLAFG